MAAQCSGSSAPIRGRDLGAPVAALRAVARVAQATHQLDERPGDAPHVPAARARRLREAVTRQRGRDDVEGVGGVAAVSLRLGEPWDDVEELDDRARPAVGEEQREGVRVRAERAWMKWIDWPSIRVRKCSKLVEPRLLRPPVVGVAPVLDQLAQVVDRDPVLPARALDLVREAAAAPDARAGPPGRRRARESGSWRWLLRRRQVPWPAMLRGPDDMTVGDPRWHVDRHSVRARHGPRARRLTKTGRPSGPGRRCRRAGWPPRPPGTWTRSTW